MYILSILLVYLGFTAASITVNHSPTTATGERGDFCATAYGYLFPDGVNLYKNTCGSIGSDVSATVTSAENVNCVTCWFFA